MRENNLVSATARVVRELHQLAEGGFIRERPNGKRARDEVVLTRVSEGVADGHFWVDRLGKVPELSQVILELDDDGVVFRVGEHFLTEPQGHSWETGGEEVSVVVLHNDADWFWDGNGGFIIDPAQSVELVVMDRRFPMVLQEQPKRQFSDKA